MNRHLLSKIIKKAFSNARLELEHFNNDFDNKPLHLEIDILQCILNQKIKIFNNLNMFKEIVQNKIQIIFLVTIIIIITY